MRIVPRILSAIAALFLAVLYIALGYAMCADTELIPEVVASATIEEGVGPFTHEQLIEGAMAVRDYSFGSHDVDRLDAVIEKMNAEAGTGFGRDSDQDALGAYRYTLPADAIEHLDDVWEVAQTANGIIAILIIGSLALSIVSAALHGFKALMGALIAAGIIDMCLILSLLIWAAGSFEGFFSAFHSLFFEEGTWVFAGDSLLIAMLPQGFWMGMGVIWLTATAVLAIVSIILGAFGRSLVRRR